MTTRRMAARSLEEGRVQEEVPEGGLDPQGVQVPPQGDIVTIRDEGNEVPVVHSDMTNGES